MAQRRALRTYATKSELARVVTAAREQGINVNSIEVGPNGIIKVSEEHKSPTTIHSEFDRWEAEGRL